MRAYRMDQLSSICPMQLQPALPQALGSRQQRVVRLQWDGLGIDPEGDRLEKEFRGYKSFRALYPYHLAVVTARYVQKFAPIGSLSAPLRFVTFERLNFLIEGVADIDKDIGRKHLA